MNVIPVPCYIDNYAWIVYCSKSHEAIIIDACEGIPLLKKLDEIQAKLVAIYCTHHHADHTDGLPELLEVWPEANVFCHTSDLSRITAATDGLVDGDTVDFCGMQGQVLHTPGHTLGSVCYYVDENLFTGDTLFSAGCGRMFEGQPAQMAGSLQRLASLPESTAVCFAHEYTLSNLKFAAFVDSDNPHVLARQKAVAALRQEGKGTAPSTLAEELRSNPFLRCDDPALIKSVQAHFGLQNEGYTEVFAALRKAKDTF